jgi:DNA-binding beta-propeller fold protein YncE/mono/diheme cytochrome c family protein
MRPQLSAKLVVPLVLAFAGACRSREEAPRPAPSAVAPVITRVGAQGPPQTPASASASAPPSAPTRALVREGSAIALSSDGSGVFIADEDHRVLRWIPVDSPLPPDALELPGAPAQVLVLADRVLVTVRDPGLLLVLRRDPAAGFTELARVPLPADAWGVAVTPGGQLALVTSAWTHQVTAVDLATATKRWSIDVPREPRAIVVRPDGAVAYVTHLVGLDLTRLVNLDGAAPASSVLRLPAAPHRAPPGRALDASLAYSAALSADGSRLFVPRHALGAIGAEVWYGRPTVDVLLTGTEEPIAPPHDAPALKASLATITSGYQVEANGRASQGGPLPRRFRAMDEPSLIQPRGCAYLAVASSLLVVAEGGDRLTELDATAADPARTQRRSIRLGEGCGAPSGVAVSADERTAYVLCRSTNSLAKVRLDPKAPRVETVPLARDPLPELASRGRRLFYDATEGALSGGLGCAGCHPEGRDDGHTYYEADVGGGADNFLGSPDNAEGTSPNAGGYARQTPMLAGRVSAEGPYGWHAQDKNLFYRLRDGVELHRWRDNAGGLNFDYRPRLDALIAFLRTGLVPPPRPRRTLTAVEERGRALFLSPETRCAGCHVPETEYTDRAAVPLRALPALPGFRDEQDHAFKTPSLLYVGGTAPYFHDGSAATLEQLVDGNADRMGKTEQLSPDDRAALVAFLRTL